MRFNSITIAPAGTLVTGDLFAFESAGRVWSGKVSALVYSSFELTPEQKDYMINHNLEIPKQGVPLGGENSSLLFFQARPGRHDHAYVDHTANVVIFSEAQKG